MRCLSIAYQQLSTLTPRKRCPLKERYNGIRSYPVASTEKRREKHSLTTTSGSRTKRAMKTHVFYMDSLSFIMFRYGIANNKVSNNPGYGDEALYSESNEYQACGLHKDVYFKERPFSSSAGFFCGGSIVKKYHGVSALNLYQLYWKTLVIIKRIRRDSRC